MCPPNALSPAQVSQGVWGGKAPRGNWDFCCWELSPSPSGVKVSFQISCDRTWYLLLVESSSKSSFLPRCTLRVDFNFGWLQNPSQGDTKGSLIETKLNLSRICFPARTQLSLRQSLFHFPSSPCCTCLPSSPPAPFPCTAPGKALRGGRGPLLVLGWPWL